MCLYLRKLNFKKFRDKILVAQLNQLKQIKEQKKTQ